MNTADAPGYRAPGLVRIAIWFVLTGLFVGILTAGCAGLSYHLWGRADSWPVSPTAIGNALSYLMGVLLILGMEKLYHKNLGQALRTQWGALYPRVPAGYLGAAAAAIVLIAVMYVLLFQSTVESVSTVVAIQFLLSLRVSCC